MYRWSRGQIEIFHWSSATAYMRDAETTDAASWLFPSPSVPLYACFGVCIHASGCLCLFVIRSLSVVLCSSLSSISVCLTRCRYLNNSRRVSARISESVHVSVPVCLRRCASFSVSTRGILPVFVSPRVSVFVCI